MPVCINNSNARSHNVSNVSSQALILLLTRNTGTYILYIYIFTVIIAVCYVILYPMSFFPGYSLSGTRIEGTRLASLEAFNSDMGSKEVLKALKLERLNHFFNGKENRERNKEMMVSKMHDNLFFWYFFLCLFGVGGQWWF